MGLARNGGEKGERKRRRKLVPAVCWDDPSTNLNLNANAVRISN